ncbi:MAG: GHKL domain-containing protein [Ruminococcus sp.]|nr:GHKL domain-containing protein [Ruminococcus sp.]
MKELLFEMLSYLTEYMKLVPVAFMFFGLAYVSKRRMIWTTVVSTILFGVLVQWTAMPRSLFLTVLLMLSALCILKKKLQIVYVFVIYIYICILDMIINGFIMYGFGMNTANVRSGTLTYQLVNMPTFIIVGIFMLAKYRRRKSITYQFSKSYTLMFALGGAAIVFYLTSIQLFAFSDSDMANRDMIALAMGICSLIFIVIIVLLISNKSQNEILKKENEAASRMTAILEEYYLMLLKKEEETKAFRHDMKSHLYCMSTLFDEGKTDECRSYLSELTDRIKDLKKSVDTGNDLVSAVINDLSAKYPKVDFTWKGHMPEGLSLSSYDICTVFSNIMKNAYEAASASEKKNVEAIVKTYNTNLLIIVKNSSSTAPVTEGDRFISGKAEEGHGYGIRNVQECVRNLNGEFDLKFDKGIVTTEVLIPDVLSSVCV